MSYPIDNLKIDKYGIEFDMGVAHFYFPRFCFRQDKDNKWIGGPMLEGLPVDFQKSLIDAMNEVSA